MALHLILGKGDVMMFSGGAAMLVTGVSSYCATVLISIPDTKVKAYTLVPTSSQQLVPNVDISVKAIYESSRAGSKVKFDIRAHKNIKVARLHTDDNDEKITEVMGRFNSPRDNIGEITVSIEKLMQMNAC